MNPLALLVFALMGIVFHELFARLRVLADIRRVLRVAPAATRVIRSSTLSDLEKERTVRRMSVDVLRDTARFTVKLAVILGACVAIAALAQGLFGVSPDGLYGLLTSWWALAALLIVMPLYARLRSRHEPADTRHDRDGERTEAPDDQAGHAGHAESATPDRAGDLRSATTDACEPKVDRTARSRPEHARG